jgi:hypothetical protein
MGLKAEGQPCPAAAKLRLIGYRNCAALRSQAATAPARVRSAAMSKIAGISEPGSELERLIAELSESGQLIFVFGIGWWTAHLTGAATPVFRGPADRRWWHVVLGDDAAAGYLAADFCALTRDQPTSVCSQVPSSLTGISASPGK